MQSRTRVWHGDFLCPECGNTIWAGCPWMSWTWPWGKSTPTSQDWCCMACWDYEDYVQHVASWAPWAYPYGKLHLTSINGKLVVEYKPRQSNDANLNSSSNMTQGGVECADQTCCACGDTATIIDPTRPFNTIRRLLPCQVDLEGAAPCNHFFHVACGGYFDGTRSVCPCPHGPV